MTKQCSIIMYHFVRELPHTRYPKMKGLLKSQFIEQLDYLEKSYEFVTMQNCIDSVYLNAPLPDKAVLLTFDDGYVNHFTSIFPILQKRKIQGCFFPASEAVMRNKVMDVNKIQFVLAAVDNPFSLIDEIYACLDEYRSQYNLESNEYYFSKLAHKGRFDPKEIIFIKHLLQKELNRELRKIIINRLFSKYVTTNEAAFARELYMDAKQLEYMVKNRMYVGGHSYHHDWLNTLLPAQQEEDVDLTLDFLKGLGSPVENWVMSYPHGACNDSLIAILKRKKCKLGLIDRGGIAKFSKENAFTLERLDTNDLPKLSGEV